MNELDGPKEHFERGLKHRREGKLQEALVDFQHVVALEPGFFRGHLNLGNTLKDLRRYDEAAAAYRGVLAQKPDHADAMLNLANVAQDLENFDEAIAGYRRTLELAPGSAPAYSNLGYALRLKGEVAEAIVACRRAILIRPDYPDAHLNLAIALLLNGNLEEGWREYEWRWKVSSIGLIPRDLKRPRWTGASLAGKKVLLHAEQGLGDTLQFVRFAPLIAAQAADVILAVQPALVGLLRLTKWPKVTVSDGAKLTGYDFELPLMSVPTMLGTTEATIPQDVPYLAVDNERASRWRKRLPQGSFNIGVVWQARSEPWLDRGRSFPLRHIAPLARLSGVRLISLQKNHGLDQLNSLPSGVRVETLGADFDTGPDAFMDTAAVISHLDLVVTADTSVAHLAGALGRPVWIALQSVADWRWMLHRDDTAWYPSARLFRQRASGQWEEMFERMAGELAHVIAGERKCLAPTSPYPRAAVVVPPAVATSEIVAPISVGELIDKITILQIKAERIKDTGKLKNVQFELEQLQAIWKRHGDESITLEGMIAELKRINATLWGIEDDIRQCERDGDFGPRFVELARAVYRNNDLRAEMKRAINLRLGSKLVEEKSYAGG